MEGCSLGECQVILRCSGQFSSVLNHRKSIPTLIKIRDRSYAFRLVVSPLACGAAKLRFNNLCKNLHRLYTLQYLECTVFVMDKWDWLHIRLFNLFETTCKCVFNQSASSTSAELGLIISNNLHSGLRSHYTNLIKSEREAISEMNPLIHVSWGLAISSCINFFPIMLSKVSVRSW